MSAGVRQACVTAVMIAGAMAVAPAARADDMGLFSVSLGSLLKAAALGHCEVRIGRKAIGPETHAIVVPDKATAQEQYAARDLNYYIELITGHALPIVAESKAGQAIGLYIGRCRALAQYASAAKPDALGIEGLHIETAGQRLFLVGNRRGVLYAVSTFLEDYLGCRWFTSDCATWPKSGTVIVPEIKRTFMPPLEYRAGDYPVSRPAEFALHSRYNGSGYPLTDEMGGHIEYRGFVHTFSALVPPGKYFGTHPEYFSEVDGKRRPGYAQLCLTNPDVLKIATDTVRRWIKETPNASIISVSQNDTRYYCECDRCKAVAEEEGSESGPLLRFVNALADNIAKDYPNIAIDTLAYQWSRKPPKVTKPRPNVIVRLCSIECCFSHPLGTDPVNASFADDTRGWHEICNRLYIWDYVINYAHSICPFPNLYVLKPNIQFFIKNGGKGIYEESCYFTKGSELQELRNYILAKTLWNPDYDTDQAIREFCDAFYGAASPMVQEYIQLIHAPFRDGKGPHVHIYESPKSFLTLDEMAKASAIFDRAEAAVQGDPTLLHRVQVARLPVIYAEIALGAPNIPELAEQFATIAHAEGVTMISEGGGLIQIVLVAILLYCLPVVAIEAWVLNKFLRVRYMQCFGYSAVMNAASWAFGLAWGALGPQDAGWKTSLFSDGHHNVPMLFVRSLLVAIVIEGAVLIAWLGRRHDMRKLLGVVAAANGASYLANLAIMLAFLARSGVHLSR